MPIGIEYSRLRRRARREQAKFMKAVASRNDIEGAAKVYMQVLEEHRIALCSGLLAPTSRKRTA